jgi:hypothetical protein
MPGITIDAESFRPIVAEIVGQATAPLQKDRAEVIRPCGK